jgi:hypothetical protein
MQTVQVRRRNHLATPAKYSLAASRQRAAELICISKRAGCRTRGGDVVDGAAPSSCSSALRQCSMRWAVSRERAPIRRASSTAATSDHRGVTPQPSRASDDDDRAAAAAAAYTRPRPLSLITCLPFATRPPPTPRSQTAYKQAAMSRFKDKMDSLGDSCVVATDGPAQGAFLLRRRLTPAPCPR